ncbi:MAG: 1-deoxy-D-xylulose-5-phosphate reductoisomerase [Omnitrophica WOR_2 bacterium]
MKRRIAILGSTGSIGTQTLEVISNYKDLFEVVVLAANNNSDLLIMQASEFRPDSVVITNEDLYQKVFSALDSLDIKVYTGSESLNQIVEMETIDIVLNAMVGFAGLKPTVSAINAGKAIAIANKEVLVVAGQMITDLAKKKNVPLLPVDSEHSAIFQCLAGELSSPEKIYLTASGGPFRGMQLEELNKVTVSQALKHPNWTMGNKITIDSATMMNKGLEVIEAKWLFDLNPEQIEILVHPQSVVHSMVQFRDGSLKAQLGVANMKLPIQYALSYPYRLDADFGRISITDLNNMTFELPDRKTFACIGLAYEALSRGGNMPCIMNAANEIAVSSFLCGKISFTAIPEIIESCMNTAEFIQSPDLNSLFETNKSIRKKADELCKKTTLKP